MHAQVSQIYKSLLLLKNVKKSVQDAIRKQTNEFVSERASPLSFSGQLGFPKPSPKESYWQIYSIKKARNVALYLGNN